MLTGRLPIGKVGVGGRDVGRGASLGKATAFKFRVSGFRCQWRQWPQWRKSMHEILESEAETRNLKPGT
jgi:hypothetical protein